MTAVVHTPTNGLDQSIDFYTRLGFTRVSEQPVRFSDGNVTIEVDPERKARAGLRMYVADPAAVVAKLGTKAHRIEGGLVTADPNNLWIYLMEGTDPVVPTKATAPSAFGNFKGLTLECIDMQRSFAFWTALGYEKTMGDADKGWVGLQAEGCPGVSLLGPLICPHLFFNPSLTWFNGKEGNPKAIAAVRAAGIPIAEEITHFNKEGLVDNIIVRDPGGFGNFLFND